MSQHNTNVSLRHMLDHSLEAVAMINGKIRADLNGKKVVNYGRNSNH